MSDFNVKVPFSVEIVLFLQRWESNSKPVCVRSALPLSYNPSSSLFTILRQQGVFCDVQVGWEILSREFTAGLLPMIIDMRCRYTAQAGFELWILLPTPPEFWGHRHVTLYLAQFFLLIHWY